MKISHLLVLFCLFLPGVLAVGIIPTNSSFSVTAGQHTNIQLTVKGGPSSQPVIFYVKSLRTNSLLIDAMDEYTESVTLAPVKLRTFTVRIDGVAKDSSVPVEWGLKIAPANATSGIGFQQVVKGNFNVRVNGVSNSTSPPKPTPTPSGGTSGGSTGLMLNVNSSLTNKTNSTVSVPSTPLPSNKPNGPPEFQDISPEGSSLTQATVPPADPRLTITSNDPKNQVLPVQSTESTSVVSLNKKTVGSIVTILLMLLGVMLIVLSTNLRGKVYE